MKKNELEKKSDSLNVRSQNDLRAKKSLKGAQQPIKMVRFNLSAGYQWFLSHDTAGYQGF